MEFYVNSVRLVAFRSTKTCCWKSIYEERKEIKAWNETVWKIMVQDHQSFAVV